MFKNIVVMTSLLAVLVLFVLGCLNAVSYTAPAEELAASPKARTSDNALSSYQAFQKNQNPTTPPHDH